MREDREGEREGMSMFDDEERLFAFGFRPSPEWVMLDDLLNYSNQKTFSPSFHSFFLRFWPECKIPPCRHTAESPVTPYYPMQLEVRCNAR